MKKLRPQPAAKLPPKAAAKTSDSDSEHKEEEEHLEERVETQSTSDRGESAPAARVESEPTNQEYLELQEKLRRIQAQLDAQKRASSPAPAPA